MLHPHNGTGGVGNRNHVVRSPTLPRANQQVASLEREAAVLGEGRPDRGKRGSQVVVGEEHLERMAGHDDQVELS